MNDKVMQTPVESQTAIFHEIFSGIQGEGVWVGVRQIFTRFHGCQLACRYCDTPASRGDAPEACAVEEQAGSREMRHLRNPLTVPALLEALSRLQAGYPHHSVSLTGGEPLLHPDFLRELLPALHRAGLRSYLETNGALPDALADLSSIPDYLAIDIKLPSATGRASCWAEHATFLAVVLAQVPAAEIAARVQVKLVFSEESLADIEQAAALVAAYSPQIPCVLQPVTPHHGGPPAPSPVLVLEAQRLAAARLADVRVIPQVHVLTGQR